MAWIPFAFIAIRVFITASSVLGWIDLFCCFRFRLVSRWRSSSSWFRTQAFQACDHGFKSRRPHQTPLLLVESKVFAELHVENCVIRCFKWFSKVLLRLKPKAFDFSTRSLSKYNTTLPFVPIAFASEGMRWAFLCYMFDDGIAGALRLLSF